MEPKQLQEFVGFNIDSRAMRISIPKKKLEGIRRSARLNLNKANRNEKVPLVGVQSLIGKLQSAGQALS